MPEENMDIRIVRVGPGRYRVWLNWHGQQLWSGEETTGTKALAVAMTAIEANPVEALGWAAMKALEPDEP